MLQQLITRIRSMGQSALDQASGTGTQPVITSPLAAAALLIEVAYADHQLDTQELAKIREVMAGTFALKQQEIDELLRDAEEYYLRSVGAQPLTRALTESWSEAQRFELLVSLWQVALAEDGIDALEEHRIRHIAELLYLPHSQFIAAKRQAKTNGLNS